MALRARVASLVRTESPIPILRSRLTACGEAERRDVCSRESWAASSESATRDSSVERSCRMASPVRRAPLSP